MLAFFYIFCTQSLQPDWTAFCCRGFKSLLDLVDNTTHDSFELYYGLFMYNQVRDVHSKSGNTATGTALGVSMNSV